MFEGQVALVTGGTRGIGAAITTMLAQSGARVAAGYSRGKDAAEALPKRCRRSSKPKAGRSQSTKGGSTRLRIATASSGK